jgi:hypothetical protein
MKDKNNLKSTLIVGACILLFAGLSEAKTIRATELGEALWSNLSKGDLDGMIVEFHEGDELPVNLSAEGDLLETTRSASSFVAVKKNFWIKAKQNKLRISFDGATYKDITDALTGSIGAGAGTGQGGPANGINLSFKATLK